MTSINGDRLSVEEANQNGFSSIQIWLITDNKKHIEILSEELS
ncbi:hypothetical protein BC781_1252 [Sediminitomix flava]|uniref:Uncharacterized protein n=1 Tax=Sediminitomix flava TaxID=379075 RepID=A0A315YR74_SEDFL|nr:hypothetical protein BC781_1252 [Sediminitomix flava]